MLALIRGRRLVLYRRIGGKLALWRELTGEPDELARAIASAREVTSLALSLGGWANALRLGLNPSKPVPATGVPARVFLQDELNR